MITLSIRAKEAIKTALAATIAMGIALWMDWEKPYWAGFAVVLISLPMEGQSLNQGAMRMLGTLVSCAVALTFIALFPQDRWWFLAVMSVYVGFCTYMVTGPKHQYFWWASGFICIVIAVDSSNSLNAFETVVERTQETGTGVLVYSLVTALLWPRSSRGALEDASRELFSVQGRLYRAYRGLMRGEDRPEDTGQQRVQELQLLQQVRQLLNAAETDSPEVWEVRGQWRLFHRQSTSLMETLGHWRTSLPEIQSLDLASFLPNLDALYAELDLRFAQIERMLGGQAPERMPQALTLTADEAAMRTLTPFQAAAVVATQGRLERLEALSRSLFDCVRDLRGDDGPPSQPRRGETPRRSFAIDPDRLRGVVSVLATLWISFLIWVYLDPPGHAGFVQMSTIIMMLVVRSGASAKAVAVPFLLGTALAAIPYLFIMPHLSSYAGLGLMIFGGTFAIGYLVPKMKTGLQAMFLRFISVQNEQTYSFLSWAEGMTMLVLACALVIALAYIPTSPRPEKVFLRLYRRFYRHAGFLISGLASEKTRPAGMTGRWRSMFYGNDLLELSGKLAACARKIDYRVLPATAPEQVQELVSSLYVLAFRIEELVKAGDHPQPDLVRERLRDDLQSWHQVIAVHFERRADDPTRLIESGLEMRKRLTERLARLEAGIEAVFDQTGEGELSAAEYRNLYQMLGSYRGLSEAAISSAQLAEGVDWAPWRETRF